ncbi:MarR family winged helix-turn-helix transcriptional regulator [Nakamurella deserti]|uniref:MarR family winged helix-turn-helix transcriptional regulator n=1 Tax=Nakamurella deserti TaxID=2164074 RepID=UPI0014783633|nr:MarR family transcriptional regulator [Nakamurella deserti]
MTITEAPHGTGEAAVESYREAVAGCSAADRDYAGDVAQRLVDMVKSFSAIKARIHGSASPEGYDSSLLLKLAHHGPMRASDLAERMCADPSTVSRQVAGMVKAGLVERQADPDDGRASILVPTASGQARVDQMVQMRGQIFAPLVADWSAEDRAVFTRLLTEFVHGLSSNIEAVKNVAAELVQPAPSNAQGSTA